MLSFLFVTLCFRVFFCFFPGPFWCKSADLQHNSIICFLQQDELKNRLIAPYSSTRPGADQPILQIVLIQNNKRSKELKQFCPPTSSDDLCLLFCINSSSMLYKPMDMVVWMWDRRDGFYSVNVGTDRKIIAINSNMCLTYNFYLFLQWQVRWFFFNTRNHSEWGKIRRENRKPTSCIREICWSRTYKSEENFVGKIHEKLYSTVSVLSEPSTGEGKPTQNMKSLYHIFPARFMYN